MSKEPNQNNEPVVDENSIISERRSKLDELRKLGVAFPNQFKPENLSSELHKNFDTDDKETLEKKGIEVSVSGRMMLKRVMGKASFATIQDNNGRIQLYVARDFINSDEIQNFMRNLKNGIWETLLALKENCLKLEPMN